MPFVTKARKKNDPALRDPLAGLNKAEKELYNIYIRALNKIQADLNDPNVLRAIREAIEAGNPQDASLALRWSSFITSLERTVPQLARQLAASANVSAKSLPKKIQINTNFENKDPRAIAWAQQRAGARIAGIRQESQKAVAEIVANGLRSQMTREQVIRQITEIVGLDSRQARALANFYEKNLQELLEDGLTFEQAERQALKLSKDYRQRLLVQRATRIARTETLAAANAGRMLSWQEADAQGLLPAGSMKRWKTATDERTCPTCGPLHNVSVSWEASFSTGDVMPPNHPNCRCTAVIVPAEPIFSQNIEKRYYRFADGEETWRNYDYRWRKIATELKRKVGKCQRCGSKSDLTVDHKKRLKDGGAKYDRKNLRVLCRSCNGKLARLGTKLRKSKNEWLFAKHLQGKHDQKRHGRGFGGGNTTQDLLVTQASKYETFEEFSRAISLYGLRPKVWHIAEADFELDPDYKPTNRLGGTSDESGLFVGDPETWQDYAVGRSDVIEFDVTDLSLTTKPLVDTSADYFPDQSGNQGFFIRPSAFPKLKEIKRMSLAEALNRAKKQQDSMPKSKTEAREIWDKSRTITKHAPGKHDQKTHAGNRKSGDYEEITENIREFDRGQDDEIFSTLKQEQSAFFASLTKDEMEAINQYQLEGVYDVINPALRQKSELSQEHAKIVKDLDKALAKSNLDYNTKVYRGISDDTGAFDGIKVGDSFVEVGYSSTSPNPAVAEAFANSTVIQGKPIVLEIDVPYGHPAIAADVATALVTGIDPVQTDEMMVELTGFTRLNEIVLPRNLSMMVTEVRDEENAKYVRVGIGK